MSGTNTNSAFHRINRISSGRSTFIKSFNDHDTGCPLFQLTAHSGACAITTRPACSNLYIPGNLFVDGTIFNVSDLGMKTDVLSVDEEDVERIVAGLEVRTFRFKSAPSVRHYGLIAQEVAQHAPELVAMGPGGNLAVHYVELVPVLLKQVQILSRELADLRAKIGDDEISAVAGASLH
jgi:hypothetical protein